MFFDEFGFSFQEPLATTWARKGKRPVLRRVTRDRRALSTAAALTLSGKIVKRHFKGSIKSAQVITALQHVHRHMPGPLILIWDRARPHRSRLTRTYLAAHPEIMVEELPAYAPELNPEEYCHGNVKQHLKNVRPSTRVEIRTSLDRGFQRLRRRPDLLLSFFHAAGLGVGSAPEKAPKALRLRMTRAAAHFRDAPRRARWSEHRRRAPHLRACH